MDEVKKKRRKREYDRRRYEENREQFLERGRRYYELNREQVLKRQRELKAEDPERVRALARVKSLRHYYKHRDREIERMRRYRAENRELMRELTVRWRRQNPEKAKEVDRASFAARKRKAPFTEEATEYSRLILSDPCCYCGLEAGTIDHIVPIRSGGESEWDNLAPACLICNVTKGSKSLLAYMLYRMEAA